MTKVTVNLTMAHIKRAKGSMTGGSCPMYFAISEALDDKYIHVESELVRLRPSGKYYSLPEEARKWIANWDETGRVTKSVKPIKFELDTAYVEGT